MEVENSKNCTPLRREAHLEVKMYKRDGSEMFGALLEGKMREAHLKVKMYGKNTMFGPLLEVEMLKKCTPLWREAHV